MLHAAGADVAVPNAKNEIFMLAKAAPTGGGDAPGGGLRGLLDGTRGSRGSFDGGDDARGGGRGSRGLFDGAPLAVSPVRLLRRPSFDQPDRPSFDSMAYGERVALLGRTSPDAIPASPQR